MVRGEFKIEQLMSDSIINLRGPSKPQKDKSRLRINQDSTSNKRYGMEYNAGETERLTVISYDTNET